MQSSTSLSSTCDLISASLGAITEDNPWDPGMTISNTVMPSTSSYTAVDVMPNTDVIMPSSTTTNHNVIIPSSSSTVMPCLTAKNRVVMSTDEAPPAKKMMAITIKQLPSANNGRARLPDPCPVPTNFSERVTKALATGELEGNDKLCFLREATNFYSGYCSNPSSAEYLVMAKTLCDRFPMLKDKKPIDGEYWVCYTYSHAYYSVLAKY